MKNYYEILGVSKDASKADIHKIYRKLAHIYHPDVGGNERKFKEINEAYGILSDDKKRAEYDTHRANHKAESAGQEKDSGDFWHKMGIEIQGTFISALFPSHWIEEIITEDDHIYFDRAVGKSYAADYRGHRFVLEYELKYYEFVADDKNDSRERIKELGYYKFLKNQSFGVSNNSKESTFRTFKQDGIFFIEYFQHSSMYGAQPNLNEWLWVCGGILSTEHKFAKVRAFYFEDGVISGKLCVMSKTEAEFDEDLYKKFVDSFSCRLSEKAAIERKKEKVQKRKEKIMEIYEEKTPYIIKRFIEVTVDNIKAETKKWK